MPVYEKTYRKFDGALVPRFRWWIIVLQEWRTLWKTRLFWVLSGFGSLIFLYIMGYIYLLDTIAVLNDHPLYEAAQRLPMHKVEPAMFHMFIMFETPLVFIITLLGGAGLICNDFRYNLVEVYFSRPLSWLDYLLGKSVALLLLGLLFTLFPALLLWAMHILFSPSLATITECYWWPLPILCYSLAVTVPCTLGVLAGSALFNSQRLASISVFMVLMVDSAIGQALPEILRDDKLYIVAFPAAVHRLGEWFFQRPNLVFNISPVGSLVFVLAVCILSLIILMRKIRKAGAAA